MTKSLFATGFRDGKVGRRARPTGEIPAYTRAALWPQRTSPSAARGRGASRGVHRGGIFRPSAADATTRGGFFTHRTASCRNPGRILSQRLAGRGRRGEGDVGPAAVSPPHRTGRSSQVIYIRRSRREGRPRLSSASATAGELRAGTSNHERQAAARFAEKPPSELGHPRLVGRAHLAHGRGGPTPPVNARARRRQDDEKGSRRAARPARSGSDLCAAGRAWRRTRVRERARKNIEGGRTKRRGVKAARRPRVVALVSSRTGRRVGGEARLLLVCGLGCTNRF